MSEPETRIDTSIRHDLNCAICLLEERKPSLHAPSITTKLVEGAVFFKITGTFMRYDRNDGEWTQRILEEDGKITRVTGVNTEYQGRVGYRCDPTREKVLIDLALLIRSFEKTRENSRGHGKYAFRESPFGRWLRWQSASETEPSSVGELNIVLKKLTIYRYHAEYSDLDRYLSKLARHREASKTASRRRKDLNREQYVPCLAEGDNYWSHECRDGTVKIWKRTDEIDEVNVWRGSPQPRAEISSRTAQAHSLNKEAWEAEMKRTLRR